MLVLHSQGGEYITDQLCVRAPSTPECDREDEHARQHAAALQMTSPTHCRERAATATASRSCNQPPPPPQPFPHPPPPRVTLQPSNDPFVQPHVQAPNPSPRETVAALPAQIDAGPQLIPIHRRSNQSDLQARAQALAQALQPVHRRNNQPAPPTNIPQPPLQPPVPQPPAVPQEPPTDDIPLGRRPIAEASVPAHDMGPMTVICQSCHALCWMAAHITNSLDRTPLFGDCCISGRIRLPVLDNVPQPLKGLLESNQPEARSFWDNIRWYNSALAFTSLGANFDTSALQGGGPYVLKLHGELYHKHGALIPDEGSEGSYAQLYIYDAEDALDQRVSRNRSQSSNVMSDLQEMLLEHNPFVNIYRQAAERLREQSRSLTETVDIQARLTYLPHTDPRRYKIPHVTNEIAIILPGNGTTINPCDIIVQLKGGPFRRVFDTQPAYVTLHYVLLFPRGELGWHQDIPYTDRREASANHRVTQLQYYVYHLFQRQGEATTILCSGKLFQQFIVDTWAAVEQRRLWYIKQNESNSMLTYIKVVDAFSGPDNSP